MRILRTEEGKGSVITVVGYGLVDPKVQVNSTCIVTLSPRRIGPDRNGIGIKFPNPKRDYVSGNAFAPTGNSNGIIE